MAYLSQAGTQLYPVDLATWDGDIWTAPEFSRNHPVKLSDPWPYRFLNGQRVWIRAGDGGWYQGKVVDDPKGGMTTLNTPGLYFLVEFRVGGCKVRKWLAPLNGHIKSDIAHTLQLLLDADSEMGHQLAKDDDW